MQISSLLLILFAILMGVVVLTNTNICTSLQKKYTAPVLNAAMQRSTNQLLDSQPSAVFFDTNAVTEKKKDDKTNDSLKVIPLDKDKKQDDKPANDKKTDDKPAEEKKPDDKPAEEKKPDDKPAEEKKPDNPPADEKKPDDKPADEQKPADPPADSTTSSTDTTATEAAPE